MKTLQKHLLVFLMVVLSATTIKGQENQTLKEFKQAPKNTEVVIGVVTKEIAGGNKYSGYEWEPEYDYVGSDRKGNPIYNGGWVYTGEVDYTKNYTEEQLFEKLKNDADKKYKETNPQFLLRNFKWERKSSYDAGFGSRQSIYTYTYICSASVVVSDPKEEAKEKLSSVIDKAFRNVREGSRIAIDQITVWSEINKEDYKDNLIDILLNKGYKVLAKEYLEKLYEEQQAQQSGKYNDQTVAQIGNFTGIGYYLNVKVTETTLRVQVINVSTGEYEGNVIVNL